MCRRDVSKKEWSTYNIVSLSFRLFFLWSRSNFRKRNSNDDYLFIFFLSVHWWKNQTFEAPVEVLDALIELAYTSKLNVTGCNMDTIGQLLRIASKYDITSLKQELSCHIKSTLSLSNALEFFKYASENGLCQKDVQLIRAYILKKYKFSSSFFQLIILWLT